MEQFNKIPPPGTDARERIKKRPTLRSYLRAIGVGIGIGAGAAAATHGPQLINPSTPKLADSQKGPQSPVFKDEGLKVVPRLERDEPKGIDIQYRDE